MYAAVQCLESPCSIRVINFATLNDLPRALAARGWDEVARRERSMLVFVTACYFNILKTSMTDFFPRAISMVAETLVSIKRVEKFLHCDELPMTGIRSKQFDTKQVVQNDKPDIPLETLANHKETDGSQEQLGITITKATAKWQPGSGESTLMDINLKVIPGRLLAIIGPVGSSKTSLLQAILGELPLTSGSIAVRGEVSYASQEPWLFASSVRNNILFGLPYDQQRYRQVVKVCALTRDFELLPYGDRTEVGERGVAISGGQKARINLARAVYKQADIYILDDPLSAVDTHVGKHLFENCICGYLRNKTCILVTHQLQFLCDINHIVILKDVSNLCVKRNLSESKDKIVFSKIQSNLVHYSVIRTNFWEP
ncbi:hypothetical protein PR048_033537 [Dryococelus australis]|uniref:ABC transporter domain-containing protein n=1 Tax=Dryococelus australis TaxID=614101 RepID=A0ABQ9G1G8_9NEOP|nr:hypothetical protein PR048_033537 [Dryococelus australis]